MPTLHSIAPCFIVDNLQSSLDFYLTRLGFEIAYKGGGDGQGEDFWAFVRRDGVMISLKAITPEIHPQPNHSRHQWARWDAYIYTPDLTPCTKSTSAKPSPCTNLCKILKTACAHSR